MKESPIKVYVIEQDAKRLEAILGLSKAIDSLASALSAKARVKIDVNGNLKIDCGENGTGISIGCGHDLELKELEPFRK